LKQNLGVMLVDKEKEGFQNVSAPLGSLDHLQAQAQEHMASVCGQPLVKMTGISPSGLNATDDNGIRVFYDTINARQQRLLTPIIDDVLKIVQLHLWGEIVPGITHEWVPLYQLDAAGNASVRKTDADTDAVLISANVITTDESRKRLASDPESPYAGLEGPAPEPPEPPEIGAEKPSTADPSEQIDKQAEGGSHTGANAADGTPPFPEFDELRAMDAAVGNWEEG
jgi:hypothetical protein